MTPYYIIAIAKEGALEAQIQSRNLNTSNIANYALVKKSQNGRDPSDITSLHKQLSLIFGTATIVID